MSMQLSENLKRLIEERNLQVSQLASVLEIPNSTLHGWLNGVPPKNIIELKKISSYFGLTVDELCFGESYLNTSKERVVFTFENIDLVMKIHKKDNL